MYIHQLSLSLMCDLKQALAFIHNHSLTAKLEQRDRQVQKVKQHLSLGEKDKQKLK